jgi:hypothetical protein
VSTLVVRAHGGLLVTTVWRCTVSRVAGGSRVLSTMEPWAAAELGGSGQINTVEVRSGVVISKGLSRPLV